MLAAALVLLAEHVMTWRGFWAPGLQQTAVKMEQQLLDIGDDYYRFVNDPTRFQSLAKEGFRSRYFPELLRNDFSVVVYGNDKPLVWSEKDILPPTFLAKALRPGTSFLRLSNGYYVIHKTIHSVDGEERYALGLIKVRNNFRIENRYLENKINPLFEVPDYVKMVLNRATESASVSDRSGNTLFFLVVDSFAYNKVPHRGKDVINFIILVFVVMAINFLALPIAQYVHTILGIVFLAVALIALRAVMIYFDLPTEFNKLTLFDPKLYASSSINKSLGDLMLNILLVFNLLYFIFVFVPFKRRSSSGIINGFILTMGYLALLGLSYLVGWIFHSLLLNSNIPFNLNNFMDLTVYSLVGLVGLSLVLLSYFLISYRLIRYFDNTVPDPRLHYIIILFDAALFMGLLVWLQSGFLPMFTVIWTIVFIVFIKRQVQNDSEIMSFANLIFLVILFALFSSFHMYTYNGIKEVEYKKSVARKIADQRDRIVEYLFLDIQDRIFKDQFIKNYFLTPFISTNEITRRIRTLYFSGYFNKYDIQIYTIDKAGQLIQSEEDDFFDLLDENAELSPPSDYLYFIPKPGGSYVYLCNLPVLYKNKFLGTVIIELSPKTYNNSHLYPELLLEENVRPVEDQEVYSYAVYIDNKMINKQGSYAYNYQFNFPDNFEEEYTLIQDEGLTHLILKAGNNKRVIVTTRSDTFLQPVTLFSYLFCVFLAFTLIVAVVRFTLKLSDNNYKLTDLIDITFRDKIQYSMIGILVISFLVIGYATVFHFSSEYNNYHLERLIRKEMAIKSSVEYIVKGNPELLIRRDPDAIPNERTLDLNALSEIHAMDINIYNEDGELINTSQPDIYEKGLQSRYIDPAAFKSLAVDKKTQYVQNEQIGSLSYLSIYVPLRDSRSRLLAYLNLPYFAKQKELQGEISAFLVALVNVYVFLLVAGGFLAYVLSNSITASLTAISAKLKFTQLGRKNEPIEWRADDEIGQLVGEYNKMIVELEQSADRLARSERESAWREMAKQIAHEIKNPLTPMKLSIQHLQRAIKDGRPDADQLALRVMATLSEQIENLTHIASEFSSFAKMPTAQNEVFELGEVVESVSDLFDENKGIAIKYIKPSEPIWVYADKNQVLRVFNNLVKNAVQAIPKDVKGRVIINIEVSNNHCTTAISDNGVGIPDDVLQKVFVPNFTTKTSGTGLGLAISKQIVENAGGEIWFQSTEGQGTTFYVKLPLHKGRS